MTSTTPIAEGSNLVARRMQATAGTSFRRHKASVESVLVVTQGRCTLRFDDRVQNLNAGDAAVIPAEAWHVVEADEDFSAVHTMAKQIRFTFSG